MEPLHEIFSEDPQENLRVENDVLKLKMSAQFGALFSEDPPGDLPPQIENEFLKNVLAFEEAHQHAIRAKVYDVLGRPLFKKETELPDRDIKEALAGIVQIMEENGMILNILANYGARTIYKFITEELFEVEVAAMEDLVPGMMMNFTYEDFYPNRKYDIHNRALEFLTHWMEQKLCDNSWELADNFILADGRILSKQEGLAKIRNMFESYNRFVNGGYVISDVNFHLNEDTTGMGYAEGVIKYDAILETGEQHHVEGPFKLYMSMEYEWWQIFYFVFPGYTW